MMTFAQSHSCTVESQSWLARAKKTEARANLSTPYNKQQEQLMPKMRNSRSNLILDGNTYPIPNLIRGLFYPYRINSNNGLITFHSNYIGLTMHAVPSTASELTPLAEIYSLRACSKDGVEVGHLFISPYSMMVAPNYFSIAHPSVLDAKGRVRPVAEPITQLPALRSIRLMQHSKLILLGFGNCQTVCVQEYFTANHYW